MNAVKIEKLNDFQIRCTLTAEDLKKNQLAITDIAFCSEKAKSLFKDMIQHASDDFGFDLTGTTSLMVELRATSPENLVLTITRMNGPEDLRRYVSTDLGSNLFENALKSISEPEPAEGIRSFRFDSLDDVISAAKAVGAGFSGINSLFRFGNGHNYQLLIHSEKENTEELARVCSAISEYGLALNCTAATENYLKEHGGLILENNALQQLAYL